MAFQNASPTHVTCSKTFGVPEPGIKQEKYVIQGTQLLSFSFAPRTFLPSEVCLLNSNRELIDFHASDSSSQMKPLSKPQLIRTLDHGCRRRCLGDYSQIHGEELHRIRAKQHRLILFHSFSIVDSRSIRLAVDILVSDPT